MTKDLTLEKQFLLRQFEVITLPSLNRGNVISCILACTYSHIMTQHKIMGLGDKITPKFLAEFMAIRICVCNPLAKEVHLRSIALEAYEDYWRSIQQLEQLTVNGSAK